MRFVLLYPSRQSLSILFIDATALSIFATLDNIDKDLGTLACFIAHKGNAVFSRGLRLEILSMLVKFPSFVSIIPTALNPNLEYSRTPAGEDKTKASSAFSSTYSQKSFMSVDPTP